MRRPGPTTPAETTRYETLRHRAIEVSGLCAVYAAMAPGAAAQTPASPP
jgi:hypothetical protein